MSFDEDGRLDDLLEGLDEQPLTSGGLWRPPFGNGGRAETPDVLFFSAGPNEEGDGLFGSISPADEEPHGHRHH
jgi:hypothetical protein